MSRWTTQIRWLISQNWDFGLKNYPIFDENYRSFLNQKILDHYFTREIGYETAQLFTIKLNVKMNEIMPLYNQFYESALIKFDPITNYKYKQSHNKHNTNNEDFTGNQTDNDVYKEGKTHGESIADNTVSTIEETQNSTKESSASNTVDNKSVYSDTPQGMLSIASIESETYASNATIANQNQNDTASATDNITKGGHSETDYTRKLDASDDTDSTRDQTHNQNNTTKRDAWEDLILNVEGYQGTSPSMLLKEFRDTFLNIDMMVINDLESLFMQLV